MVKKNDKINLTTREFIGEITEVSDKIGYYKVKIPELSFLQDNEIIVYDASVKTRYTESKYGTYGYFYPLQVGTKVVIRFKKDDLNSGVIERIHTYFDIDDNSKHPNYYLVTKTLSDSKIYLDDKENKIKISLISDAAFTEYKPSEVKIHANNHLLSESTSKIDITAPKIYLNGGSSVSSNSGSTILGPLSTFPDLRIPDDITEIVNINENVLKQPEEYVVNGTIQKSISKSIYDQREIENLKSILQKHNININIQQTIKSKYPIYKEYQFGITDVQKLQTDYSNGYLAKIKDTIDNYREDIQNQYDLVSNYLSNPKYIEDDYKYLKQQFDELTKSMDNLYNSPEFNSLSDEDKQLLIDNMNFITDTYNTVLGELNSINSRFNFDDEILTTDLFPIVDKSSAAAFNFLEYTKNELDNNLPNLLSNIEDAYNNIHVNINKKLQDMNLLANIKTFIDTTIGKINSVTNIVRNAIDDIVDFKKRNIDLFNMGKFDELLNQYYKGNIYSTLKSVFNELTHIKSNLVNIKYLKENNLLSIVPLTILENKLLNSVKDITDIDSSISLIDSKLISLKDLFENVSTDNFLNNLDGLNITLNELVKNTLPTIGLLLASESDKFLGYLDSVIGILSCFFNINGYSGNCGRSRYNIGSQNFWAVFALNFDLLSLIKSLLGDKNINLNILPESLLNLINCITDQVKSLDDTVNDLINKYDNITNLSKLVDDIVSKHANLKLNYNKRFMSKIVNTALSSLAKLKSGFAILNSMYCHSNSIPRQLNDLYTKSKDNTEFIIDMVRNGFIESSFIVGNYNSFAPYISSKDINALKFEPISNIKKEYAINVVDCCNLSFKINSG